MCPNNDVTKKATQECLDQNVLPLADGSGTKYFIPARNGLMRVDLKLPEGLVCDQCVLQWKYNTGKIIEQCNCSCEYNVNIQIQRCGILMQFSFWKF